MVIITDLNLLSEIDSDAELIDRTVEQAKVDCQHRIAERLGVAINQVIVDGYSIAPEAEEQSKG